MPVSCCVAFITSFSAKVSPSGTVISHVPSSCTVASPITSSPLVTVIVAPFTPVPVILVDPAFVSLIAGVALFSFLSELLSSTPAVWPFTGISNVLSPFEFSGVMKSSSFNVTLIGPSTFSPGFTEIFPVVGSTVTVTSVPSSSFAITVVGVFWSWFLITRPVFWSLPFGSTSCGLPSTVVFAGVVAVAVAVIVALSAVIAVPGAVDHVGFSYPSFAVTVGYLSAVNAVPSFTSYTLLFAMSFTPSPFLNVTLTYPSGVGASGLFVLSITSSNFATVIFAFALSVDLSG